MHQLINKKLKIFFYVVILLLFSTFININFHDFISNFFSIKKINIYGVNGQKKEKILSKFSRIVSSNIVFINKDEFKNILDEYNFLENYKVNKKYPSEINIFLEETKLVANTNISGKNYFLGSNGKLILTDKANNNIPNIFGKFNTKNFFQLISKLENNNFNISNITDFYYFKSQRWDIKTNKGLLIRLPFDNLDKAIKNASILILGEIDKKKIIDLRVSNQVIITNE